MRFAVVATRALRAIGLVVTTVGLAAQAAPAAPANPAGQAPGAPPAAALPVVPPPGTQSPAPAAAPAPAAQAPATAPQFGRVLVDGARPRCWPGTAAMPPMFEDPLAKDTVVRLGRTENGFRAVELPLGPLGYVSKKFTAVGDDGAVTTKGQKVAFRYRARSGEAPVAQLAEGTALAVVGEQEDWWQARVAGIEAWLPEAEVQGVDAADAAAAEAYAALGKQHQAAVQVRLDQIAAQKARAAQDQLDLAAVKAVEDAFRAEQQKPLAAQAYAPLLQQLAELEPKFAAESAGKPAIAALRTRIEDQRFVAEATALRDSKPVPATDVDIAPLPKDKLQRFDSSGWLRYEGRIAGPGVYYLEKGGQRLHHVICQSGRYDLALFLNREVGVSGPRRRPTTESLSILEVERIEVLGTLAR